MDTKYTRYSMKDVTTVKLNRKTKKMLADLGKKDDTYDDIVRRLIEFYMKNKAKVEEFEGSG